MLSIRMLLLVVDEAMPTMNIGLSQAMVLCRYAQSDNIVELQEGLNPAIIPTLIGHDPTLTPIN